MEAVNYPIKYTFMPIIEDCVKKAYIVIKCYEVGEPITIESNGMKKTVHKIVPFYNGDLLRQEPAVLSDGRCYNFSIADMVFDDLQTAIKYTRVLNQTRILHGPNHSFAKYYDLEYQLLNDKGPTINNKIVDINEYKARARKRDKHEWKLFNRI